MPATFGRSDDLAGSTFTGVNLRDARFFGTTLRGARFAESDLTGVVMRGVDVDGLDIDAPWLSEGANPLRVNGVEVGPFVVAERDRRFPGRAARRAADPEGLRAAWQVLQRAWAAAVDRAAAMPPGTVEVSVDGEWSFAQTLRHLVLATDMWLGKAILHLEQPFHPLGLLDAGTAQDQGGPATAALGPDAPSYAEVLKARAGRVAMVRDFLAAVTAEDLAAERRNPHAPEHSETVLSCLHTILEEEWEHLRFATRDLDSLEA
jgi:hypothetical protein